MLKEKEIFKPIQGYEELYLISSWGNVISLPKDHGHYITKKKVMIPQIHPKGHYIISLKKNGKAKSYWVAILTAKEFVDNPKNLPIVNHKDLDKFNNYYKNLEWCSHKQNTQHFWDNTPDHKSSNKDIELVNPFGKVIKSWKRINDCAAEYETTRRTIKRWIINSKFVGKGCLTLRYKLKGE